MQIEKKMREVTLNAPSYKELKQIYMAREIYMPSKGKRIQGSDKKKDSRNYTTEEINEIHKKFFKGFNAFRGNPELTDLLEGIDDYMRELKTYGVQDSEVKNVRINFLKILGNFLVIIPMLLINLVFVSVRAIFMLF